MPMVDLPLSRVVTDLVADLPPLESCIFSSVRGVADLPWMGAPFLNVTDLVADLLHTFYIILDYA